LVLAALDGERAVVLDADTITSFAKSPRRLATALKARDERATILTPHEGEFPRLFSDISNKTPGRSKLERVRVEETANNAFEYTGGENKDRTAVQ